MAIFNQTGGANVAGILSIGITPSDIATYLLSGGTTTINANAYVGGSSSGAGGTGTVTISNTGQFNVTGTLTVFGAGQVNVNGGSCTVGAISIATGGVVNVNSPMIVNYGAGKPSPIVSILSYLQSGYNGGAWNGVGINSSSVAGMNASQNALVYEVGYADGSDGVVSGLSSGQIEIMPTFAGDATLQGNVAYPDFLILQQNFGSSGTWDQGNFTYGNAINFNDFKLLAQNFTSPAGLTSGQLSSMNGFAAQFGDRLVPNPDGVGFSIAAIPEPASLSLLLLTSAGLLTRRRRKLY